MNKYYNAQTVVVKTLPLGRTLQATSLVHEAYLRLMDVPRVMSALGSDLEPA